MQDNLALFYVDDDIDDLDMFEMAAQGLALEVHTFDTGNLLIEALKVNTTKPNIIFVDLNMPRMDGYEVITEIKKIDRLDGVPVVVLTTASDSISVKKSIEIGAMYYITKPTTIDKLRDAIRHTIGINWDNFTPSFEDFTHKH